MLNYKLAASILLTFTTVACTTTALPPPAAQNMPQVSSAAVDSNSQRVREALEALSRGGYLIVVRHGATNPDEADVDPFHLENCGKQRMLSDTGRAQARAVGKVLQSSAIPVDMVYASRYCRAIETAKLLTENLHAKPVLASDDFAEAGQVVSPNEGRRRNEAMRKLASQMPARGTNNLVVSHRPNIMEAFGADFFNVSEGEMIVIQPKMGATAGYEVKWRIKVSDFSAYSKSLNK